MQDRRLCGAAQDGGGGALVVAGEPLDVVAREANVSVAKLTEWRERALAGE
jgi:hypothetical protein